MSCNLCTGPSHFCLRLLFGASQVVIYSLRYVFRQSQNTIFCVQKNSEGTARWLASSKQAPPPWCYNQPLPSPHSAAHIPSTRHRGEKQRQVHVVLCTATTNHGTSQTGKKTKKKTGLNRCQTRHGHLIVLLLHIGLPGETAWLGRIHLFSMRSHDG